MFLASVCTKWLHSCNPGWFADLPAVRPMGSNAQESCAFIPLKLRQRLAEKKKKKNLLHLTREKCFEMAPTRWLWSWTWQPAALTPHRGLKFENWMCSAVLFSCVFRPESCVWQVLLTLRGPHVTTSMNSMAWSLRLSEVVVLRGQNRALSWWIQL